MAEKPKGESAKKILICEHDIVQAAELARTLTQMGYEVLRTVCSGRDVVRVVGESRPDLIILDVNLAGGGDETRAAGEISDLYNIPVIYLFSRETGVLPDPGKGIEPYGHLFRPVTLAELRITIEAALYRHEADRRIRETEAKYRALLEQIPAVTYTAALDGASSTLYVSPQVEALLGYSQHHYASDADLWRKSLHPDDLERVMTEVKHSHDTGEPFDSEYRMIGSDGRTVWFRDKARLVRDDQGRPLCLQGIMLDITETKSSAQALRESEQRFRAVFNNAAVGIDVLDRAGRFIEVNSALAHMLGYSRQELMQLSPLDLTHPDDLTQSIELLEQLVKGQVHSYRFEKRYVRKDGSTLFGDIMVSKIASPDGEYDSTIGVISDVTERRTAEDALRVKTHDLGERVKELNCLYRISQLREKCGISLEETLQGVVDLIPPAWQHSEIACARIIWKDREFKTQHFGTPVSRQSANIVVHGEVQGYVEVVYLESRPESDEGPFMKEERDLVNAIAERLGRMLELAKAEQELRRYQSELEKMVQARTMELVKANDQLSQEIAERRKTERVLKESAAALERSNQDLEQFAYVAAHDLREPLIGVAAYLKLLEKRIGNDLDSESRRYLSRSLDTVMKMDFLIHSLLEYSRVAEAKREPLPTDAHACLTQALANLRTAIKDCRATVIVDTLPTVMADSVHVTQLFQNLIANAVRFKGDLPLRIHVGVESQSSDYHFFVRDNGVGIDRPHFDRIFQIFQRVDNVDTPGGTGIGLATCKKIVERYGGRIWVESEPGKGSVFRFTLPAVDIRP